ncbi:MAG: hypothetical protein AAGD25_13980 [Cyanobacteria bacterium P01_F01_bin.150]
MISTTDRNKRIVIAYDMNLDNFQMATAIRGVLEFYGLQVTLMWLNTKQDAINFFAGHDVKADYTIFCAHGIGKESRIWFTVVEKVPGTDFRYEEVLFNLTPDNLRDYVKTAGGTFISTACDSGCEDFANAFLGVGYRAFIGPHVAVDVSSSVLFICGFFSNLLAGDRDIHKANYTEREAVERAAAIQEFPDVQYNLYLPYGNNDAIICPLPNGAHLLESCITEASVM